MESKQLKKALPLIAVLIFGIGVIKLWVWVLSPLMLHNAKGYEIIGMIITLIAMVGGLSFWLHKTGAFED